LAALDISNRQMSQHPILFFRTEGMDWDQHKNEIAIIQARLHRLDEERAQLLARLKHLKKNTVTSPPTSADNSTPLFSIENVHLFRSLFRGREDVYPLRWDNQKTGRSGYSLACGNEWVSGVCNKPQVKCGDCKYQAFLPVTDEVIRRHLMGRNPDNPRRQDFTVGVYPLLPDETCWFLAADFDKEHWRKDVSVFLETCREKDIPAYVERSRSGNDAHVWMFFSQPIPAIDARKLGSYLLTETMESYPDLGFASYDRLFPNQDIMPSGGFGNLIALPLQYHPRQKDNSVFLDEQFEPYPDQWRFLDSVQRMTPEEVSNIVSEAISRGCITGVELSLNEEDAKEPWKVAPSRKSLPEVITDSLPASIAVVQGNQLYLPKEDLPPKLINRLIRIAAFQNPEFYKAQAMRFSTFNKPRIIACAETFPHHIGLPRGCLDEVLELLNSLNITVDLIDERNAGEPISTTFLGILNKEQKPIAETLLNYDAGILSATTGFGKTVLAAHIIAARKRNTLILVHRKQLMDQWLAQLQTFLNTENLPIGQIGGGKRKSSGQVDVALIQSLVQKGMVDDCVADYGQLIVDECHHLSAVSFEAVARQCKAKYVLGLTATPKRKDGQHPIIFMQCGPIRYHVDAKLQAEKRPFDHHVIPRYTKFRLPATITEQYDRPPIQTVYAELSLDATRNHMIIADVRHVLEMKRSPIILTEGKEHVAFFAKHLQGVASNIIVLQGGMSTKERKTVLERLGNIRDDEERILIATGRYIGEGFDDARLDTLFLAMPVSWKGTLAQYAGRLHRTHHNKTEVRIYDYVDHLVPMLERMNQKRLIGYKSLGYTIASAGQIEKA